MNWRNEQIDLGIAPTPVIDGSGLKPGLWIKDDGHSASRYGGNKPRKLAYLLHGAPERIATMGAMGSHHCLATAVHGMSAGHQVDVVTFQRPHTPHVEQVLQATQARATMHVTASLDDAKDTLAQLGAQGVMTIPAGGSSARGALGFVQAGEELIAQVNSGLLPRPRRIWAAMGTAGTVVGLAMAVKAAGWDTEVMAVRVVPHAWLPESDIVELAAGVARLTGLDPAVPTIDDTQLGDGYGEATTAGVAAVDALASVTPLETTYTGKALAAALADTDTAPAVFWQTHNTWSLAPLLAGTAPCSNVWA
ncbi:MAG: pyridoxal-phosphate dependent enzyme [Phycisphaerales bacterium]|nr:pyridoxal-phosphate dependent enzyme [Phycisphaerales bacterium]